MTETVSYCSWLGTERDEHTRRLEPIDTHLCYAQDPPATIGVDHQADFCLTADHVHCLYHRPAPAPDALSGGVPNDTNGNSAMAGSRHKWQQAFLWSLAILAAIAVVYHYTTTILTALPTPTPSVVALVTGEATPSPTFTILPAETPSRASASSSTPTPFGMPTAATTPNWFVVTSTPIPANVVTAAAMALTATANAATTGRPTPLPTYVVTATPNWLVVTGIPTAANAATAEYRQAVETAKVMLTGTPTPTPHNLATATETPLPTATPRPTATPAVIGFVVTSTPTPGNVVTAAAVALTATANATTAGTPTPLPPYVVTATSNWVVVTNTPTPAHAATAAYHQAVATANVILKGTPTPIPHNLATATNTPLPTRTPRPTATPPVLWLDEITGTPTPAATPTLPPVPAQFRGKILFLSDRGGDPRNGNVYVLDPDTGRIGLVTARWPHDVARGDESVAPDGHFRAYVAKDGGGKLQIFVYSNQAGASWQLTFMTGTTYNPVWSPVGGEIAFVSTQAGSDDLYVIDTDGKNLRRITFNEWEWDKSPSWSPDGRQLVFWSNQSTGRKQLWIINPDGTDRHLLLESPYNDWDPVWVK